MVEAFLDYQRDVIAVKTDGLDAEQLHRPLAPTTMTLGGMLLHLAFVEDWWTNRVLHDRTLRPPFDTVDWRRTPDWDWEHAADFEPDELRALWREAVEAARRDTADLSYDALSRRHLREGPVSLRWIQVHLIEEYARHCGHADLLREAIDGQTGDGTD